MKRMTSKHIITKCLFDETTKQITNTDSLKPGHTYNVVGKLEMAEEISITARVPERPGFVNLQIFQLASETSMFARFSIYNNPNGTILVKISADDPEYVTAFFAGSVWTFEETI